MTSQTSQIIGLTFFLLNWLDGMLTLRLVQLAGTYDIELNPLVRLLMQEIGSSFMYSKILIGALIAVLIILFWDRFKWFRLGVVGIISLYAGIVIMHLIGLWQLK